MGGQDVHCDVGRRDADDDDVDDVHSHCRACTRVDVHVCCEMRYTAAGAFTDAGYHVQDRCNEELDECWSAPCLNSGACVDVVGLMLAIAQMASAARIARTTLTTARACRARTARNAWTVSRRTVQLRERLGGHSLRATGGQLRGVVGTMQASLTLASDASPTDDEYNGMLIATGGDVVATGVITDYDGTVKTFTATWGTARRRR